MRVGPFRGSSRGAGSRSHVRSGRRKFRCRGGPRFRKRRGADVPNYSLDDYRNFFGLCWISNPDEILRYARQMGYKHVYYQGGMEKNPLSKGMYFVMESPEYSWFTGGC